MSVVQVIRALEEESLSTLNSEIAGMRAMSKVERRRVAPLFSVPA